MKIESVILCEGFHDRAFWQGWLLYLGCTDPGAPTAAKTDRSPILDPWGPKVVGGQYAFLSNSGHFIRVLPVHGRTNIFPTAKRRLHERDDKPLKRLVLNVDTDTRADGTGATPGLRQQDVKNWILTEFGEKVSEHARGEFEIDRGSPAATKVALIRWEANDPHCANLPPQQTLERLVCAVLVAVYPERVSPLERWLADQPGAPPAGAKEHAWSHMARWHAEEGCEGFYRNLWNDAAIVESLKNRLSASGAWQIVADLAS